jgi:hypothetical protein
MPTITGTRAAPRIRENSVEFGEFGDSALIPALRLRAFA